LRSISIPFAHTGLTLCAIPAGSRETLVNKERDRAFFAIADAAMPASTLKID